MPLDVRRDRECLGLFSAACLFSEAAKGQRPSEGGADTKGGRVKWTLFEWNVARCRQRRGRGFRER